MAIGAVLFDFYGTLVRPRPGTRRYGEILAECGYPVEAAVLAHFYDHPDFVDHRSHSRSEDHYQAWTRSRLEGLCHSLGVPNREVGPIVERLEEASGYGVEAYPEVATVLAAVRDGGMAVAVCSNWGWHLDPFVEQAGLDGLVDVAVTSARVGVRKPHQDIYHHTLAAIGAQAGDSLFVGDTWLPDVEGPLRAGLAGAVHVDRRDGWASDHAVDQLPERVHRVHDLSGVLHVLA